MCELGDFTPFEGQVTDVITCLIDLSVDCSSERAWATWMPLQSSSARTPVATCFLRVCFGLTGPNQLVPLPLESNLISIANFLLGHVIPPSPLGWIVVSFSFVANQHLINIITSQCLRTHHLHSCTPPHPTPPHSLPSRSELV